ncbi:DEAD/DEAH box helicase family protein [Rhizobium laguerreae]|nr:DEAD/DEAH box helicase family protein [Rhizobium laguerreae]
MANSNDNDFGSLKAFVAEECDRRLRAYSAQPRDANEHYETEIEVLSGGYAYRQLFELVQNAADAIGEGGEGHGRIHVRLDRSRLVAANTGAALDKHGVVALLNARSSTKRAGQIGRFGIGFKSLLKLGGSVDLVSRSIGLCFDPEWCRAAIRAHLSLGADARAPGMRLAKVLDPATQGSPLWKYGGFEWATTVVTAEIIEAGIYDRLADELAAFPAEFVLFLEADVELILEVGAGIKRTITRRRDGDVFVVDDGTTESRWRLFQTKVRITDASARADAQHLQARDEVPLAWAVPLGAREIAGRFWAFFPTQSETLASGILNAPWKLNSDRTNVIAGPWNSALMTEAARLIADNITALSTSEDPGAPVSALPRQLERKDELAAALVDPLWDLLVDRAILADGVGRLRVAQELGRHPLEDGEALKWWSAFADETVRGRLVHPSCQSGRRRASRLEAYARESAARAPKDATPALTQWNDGAWLEAAAAAEPSVAIPFLHFVDEVVNTKKLIAQQRIRQARIVPSETVSLIRPHDAIIAPLNLVPSGFTAVSLAVIRDERANRFLTETLAVKELTVDVWQTLLGESLTKAVSADDVENWINFWANLCEAPGEAVDEFLDGNGVAELRYRNADGEFCPRDELIVVGPEDDSGVRPELKMDLEFHAAHRSRLPDEIWQTYPPLAYDPVYEWDGFSSEQISPYFDKVCELGFRKVTGNPQFGKLGILDRDQIRMPSGWRLLPFLPAVHAAALTLRLIEATERTRWGAATTSGSPTLPHITYGHSTRRDRYESLSAAHPLVFWLTRYGILAVGSALVRLKSLPAEVAEALASVGHIGAQRVQAVLLAHSAQADIRVGRDVDQLNPGLKAGFWEAVFSELAVARENLTEFRPLWERAASEKEAPSLVPTSAGPIAISEIFVGVDGESAATNIDDGRIVILSAAAAECWERAGAKPLLDNSDVEIDEQLGDPLLLRDIFPELALVLKTRAAKRADAVWVRGLVERAGHRVTTPVIARDSTDLIMIDRDRFHLLGWLNGRRQILDALISFGLLEGDAGTLVEELAASRALEARAKVREAIGLPARLLRAIGASPHPLMSILPEPVVEAMDGTLADETIAELAIAVHGPTILTKLFNVLEAEGLQPPGRWGGEAARQFVVELGFPIEFATSASVRRDAELLVSGPIALPELHDYQKDILHKLEDLLLSGAGRRRAVVSLPTGGGKTRVAAEAVVRLVLNGQEARSALWIAQTDELCEQAVQCFRQLWSNLGVEGEELRIVRLWGGQTNPTPPEAGEAIVVVASIQTLNARMEHEGLDWLSRPGIVVIDECHHAIAPSYSSLLRWLDVQTGGESERDREPPVLGLSATPWRGRDNDESARLASRFDRRWLPADQEGLHQELKRRKVLSELRYSPIQYDRPVHLSPSDVRHFEQYGELPESVVEELGSDPERNERILDRVLSSDASSILLFANSVKHAQYLAARLHLAGCPAAAVSGETDRLARQHFIRRFRSGEIRVLCNHSVLTTGFDAPRSDMVLISRPVFSPVRYMQMVGRGLRGPANGGTDTCEVATVEDNILSYRDKLAYHYCRRFFDVAR